VLERYFSGERRFVDHADSRSRIRFAQLHFLSTGWWSAACRKGHRALRVCGIWKDPSP